MNPSLVRARLENGSAIFTAKTSYHNPDVIGLIGSFGFHGVWICLEHTLSDPSRVYSLIQSCQLANADAIVRVKPGNYADLLWLLEAGVRGIMLPRVRDAEEVREIVAAMKFPPLGRRGVDGIGPEAKFGRMPMTEYFAEANRENYLVVQIEDPEVIPHIDAIASLPGVDVLFVGPADLTLALGKFGQTDDPKVVAVFRQVADACRRHGKVAGLPCSPEQVPFYHEMGFRFFNVTSDYRCVSDGLRSTVAALHAAGFDPAAKDGLNGKHDGAGSHILVATR
jgi:4-hydroxy-2-oxoheptanedioate aldolase